MFCCAHCVVVIPQDIPNLSPATDFYKKLALDCSGQQVAVDLFLLSSQYCDLASLGEWCLLTDTSELQCVIINKVTLFQQPAVLFICLCCCIQYLSKVWTCLLKGFSLFLLFST